MTDRDRSNPESLTTLLNFRERKLRQRIHTSIPANVVSYDAGTRRAVVQPALRMVLDDGTVRRRAELVDVPVLAQAGGGFLVHAPLDPGDPVMLHFSMRGFSRFKKTLLESDPDVESVLSPAGAYVSGGFIKPDASPLRLGRARDAESGRLRGGSRPL